MSSKAKKYCPLILSAVLLLIDQCSKVYIVRNIPEGEIGYTFWNDFLYICHVRNTGVAFSIGAGFSTLVRIILFLGVPILAMAGIFYLIVADKSGLTRFQRWLVAGILGGGLGTITDRVFRFKTGVVDFISVKFYGLLGMERWPTFNFSDSCVVVFVILFGITILFSKDGKKADEADDD